MQSSFKKNIIWKSLNVVSTMKALEIYWRDVVSESEDYIITFWHGSRGVIWNRPHTHVNRTNPPNSLVSWSVYERLHFSWIVVCSSQSAWWKSSSHSGHSWWSLWWGNLDISVVHIQHANITCVFTFLLLFLAFLLHTFPDNATKGSCQHRSHLKRMPC